MEGLRLQSDAGHNRIPETSTLCEPPGIVSGPLQILSQVCGELFTDVRTNNGQAEEGIFGKMRRSQRRLPDALDLTQREAAFSPF